MLNNSHSILACCPTINIKLAGDALKHKGSYIGIYQMQPGFSNGQRYWISSNGNAIWMKHAEDGDEWYIWYIGDSEDLGTTNVALYVPKKDPSKECPHGNLQSNWRYAKGKEFFEDVSNSVRIHCLKGKHNANTYFEIVKSSYDLFIDYGEIQFIKKEFLVAPNSYEIEVSVDRNHVVKEKVKVNWKLVSDDRFHLSNGTISFNDENDQKVIKLDLKNIARNLSTKIELYEPSNGYQLGENKVANISFVSKFLLKLIQIKKEV